MPAAPPRMHTYIQCQLLKPYVSKHIVIQNVDTAVVRTPYELVLLDARGHGALSEFQAARTHVRSNRVGWNAR